METMHAADANLYEIYRTLGIIDQLKTNSGVNLVGNGGAAQISRNEMLFLSNTQKYVDQMTPIIALDGSNPLPYLYRSLGYIRLRQFDKALQDADTAQKLGPPHWSMPTYLYVGNDFLNQKYNDALPLLDQILQGNPKDWYAIASMGTFNYLEGNLDFARTKMDQAIALSPPTSLPYILAASLAIRQGRIADAKSIINTILTNFSDPSFTVRVFNITFGDPETSKIVLGVMLSASSNLFLGQYDNAIKDAELAISIDPSQPDLYLVEGFAYCNLSKWAEAEKAYTAGLALDPNYMVLYALRAEVRNKQSNPFGALSDIQAMQKIKGSEELTKLVNDALKSGSTSSFGCQNFFSSGPATAAP
jgi:tetratricopeptide (TPR) repeat protein